MMMTRLWIFTLVWLAALPARGAERRVSSSSVRAAVLAALEAHADLPVDPPRLPGRDLPKDTKPEIRKPDTKADAERKARSAASEQGEKDMQKMSRDSVHRPAEGAAAGAVTSSGADTRSAASQVHAESARSNKSNSDPGSHPDTRPNRPHR